MKNRFAKVCGLLCLLFAWNAVAFEPLRQLPVAAAAAPRYFMDIYVRHPVTTPLIRHHDYIFTAVENGQVTQTESNWNWDASHFQWYRPLRSIFHPTPGKMSTFAHSEAAASKTPTITRHYQVPLTPEAYASEMQHLQELRSGQRGYTAIPRGQPGTDNCITAGIPPIAGTVRPGIGMFAAPRVIRTLERRGLIAK